MSRAATAARPSAHAVPTQRSRRRRSPAPVTPLGSLIAQPSHTRGVCHACGGTQVTRLQMQLTDGTEVEFTSCHRCETRRWDADGVELSMASVLERTRKTA